MDQLLIQTETQHEATNLLVLHGLGVPGELTSSLMWVIKLDSHRREQSCQYISVWILAKSEDWHWEACHNTKKDSQIILWFFANTCLSLNTTRLSCCFGFYTKTSPPVLAPSSCAIMWTMYLLYDSHPSFGKYYVHFMERERGRSAATTGDNAVLQASFVKRNKTDASLL